MKTEIKICGIARAEDAVLAVSMGATQIGCVMTVDSPRFVEALVAKEIFAAAGKKVRHVLVFRSGTKEGVLEAARVSGARYVQLAGFPEPDIQAIEKSGLTAYRVHEIPTGTNLMPPILPEPTEKAPVVLHASGASSGLTFPWEILGADAPKACLISGCVRPENVCALLTHRPYGINISSGIEREPGVKDPDRMALLFEAMRDAEEWST